MSETFVRTLFVPACISSKWEHAKRIVSRFFFCLIPNVYSSVFTFFENSALQTFFLFEIESLLQFNLFAISEATFIEPFAIEDSNCRLEFDHQKSTLFRVQYSDTKGVWNPNRSVRISDSVWNSKTFVWVLDAFWPNMCLKTELFGN